MPTLHWIGKDKVINHHREVPYKVLEHQYRFTAEQGTITSGDGHSSPLPGRGAGGEGGNLIIQGDNLEALKSLLPRYEGKVKCIYIDPPYNTGNEGWVYNDNVNDPRIKKWLGDVVGKEGEDLSRHDKWLCMMYPRLVLLHKLLADDGSIWVSIDDNEQASLRHLMNEIFGSNNFVATIAWQKKQSPQNDAINISDMHEYVLCYAKQIKSNRNDPNGFSRNLIPKTDVQRSRYKNPDNDERGNWTSGDITSNKTRFERPNLYYPIVNPNTGQEVLPSESTVWRYERETLLQLISEGRIWWGKNGTNFPRLKNFESDVASGVVPSTWWERSFSGDNQEGRRQFRELFQDVQDDFSTPKPTRLIERILQIASDTNSLILDSFAGSGTTAHAVLNLNKQDGGNRKFILIEMMDYAETITAERVKRVMQGYGEGKKAVEGTGGAFDYYTLGAPLFNGREQLNEEVGVERIREYIWYSETRSPLQASVQLASGKSATGKGVKSSPYYLGTHERTAFYFVYEKDELTTLDHDLLSTITVKGERTVIYADNCLLPKKFLEQHGIVFKKIPRDISRF